LSTNSSTASTAGTSSTAAGNSIIASSSTGIGGTKDSSHLNAIA
jgi:hypothetical protein